MDILPYGHCNAGGSGNPPSLIPALFYLINRNFAHDCSPYDRESRIKNIFLQKRVVNFLSLDDTITQRFMSVIWLLRQTKTT